MRRYFARVISVVSVLFMAGGFVANNTPVLRAETLMRFTAPFISNAGTTNATGDRHFLTINVTGFPLESLLVTLPDSMQFDQATVTNQSGQVVNTRQALEDGTLFFRFDQPVMPNEVLKVQFTGAETDTPGNRLLYRVAAVHSELETPLPLGTAMIRLPDIDL